MRKCFVSNDFLWSFLINHSPIEKKVFCFPTKLKVDQIRSFEEEEEEIKNPKWRFSLIPCELKISKFNKLTKKQSISTTKDCYGLKRLLQ